MCSKKHRRKKRIPLIFAILLCMMFVAKYEKNSNNIVDRVVSASLSDIRLPAFHVGNTDLSTLHLPDISLLSVFDAIADVKNRIGTGFNNNQKDISYIDILPDEECVSSKLDNTIRLSDICAGIDKKDIVDTASGLVYSYFSFWSSLADEYCLGIEPALEEIEKENAESHVTAGEDIDTKNIVEDE